MQMLKQDPQMRQPFFAEISAPIVNKMFECAYAERNRDGLGRKFCDGDCYMRCATLTKAAERTTACPESRTVFSRA